MDQHQLHLIIKEYYQLCSLKFFKVYLKIVKSILAIYNTLKISTYSSSFYSNYCISLLIFCSISFYSVFYFKISVISLSISSFFIIFHLSHINLIDFIVNWQEFIINFKHFNFKIFNHLLFIINQFGKAFFAIFI